LQAAVDDEARGMTHRSGWSLAVAALALMLAASCAANKEITEKDRVAATNFYKLGVTLYHQGNVPEALKNLTEAEQYNPRDKDIKYLFGLIFLGKRLYDRAEESLKAAIDIDPEFSDAYVALASVYIAQEKWQKAIDQLKKPEGDILFASKDKVYDNLGWCHFKLGNAARAIEYFKMAVTEKADNCHAYYNMGLVHKELQQLPEALVAFEMSVKRCPDFMHGYYELGQAAIKLNDKERARPALEKCVELGKETLQGGECRNYLRLIPAKKAVNEQESSPKKAVNEQESSQTSR